MFYTIYRITNTINGKEYTGKHQTEDLEDNYMGSGKYLKRAIKKHGIENFTKEILYIFETEYEMNAKEKELVTEEYCSWTNTYNLCPGGHGGFGYINAKGLRGNNFTLENILKGGPTHREMLKSNTEYAKEYSYRISEGLKKYYIAKGSRTNWLGKKHKEESKLKMSLSKKDSPTYMGANNSQYGTCWITNDIENKKIRKDDLDNWISKGYHKGRKNNLL